MTAAAATAPRGKSAPRPVAILDDILLELVDIDENIRVDAGDLDGLAASIAELGVQQPIKVTRQLDGRYKAVFGQRRILASRQAGVLRIPAIVEPPSDVDQAGERRSIEQLSENLQRQDLNAIEEAVALRDVLDRNPKLTQAELARTLGVSPAWVSNTLGLLEATAKVQALVRDGALTASHSKAIQGLPEQMQDELAQEAVDRAMSAHGLEDRVQMVKRNAEWQRQRDAESRKAAEERKAKVLTSLEKRHVAKDARIHVAAWYADATLKSVAGALRKAGYTDVREGNDGVGSKADAIDCTCTAWLIELSYGSAIKPACVVRAHRDAKIKAENDQRLERYDLENRIRARLGEVLAEQVAGIGPEAARVALWIVLSWGIDDWTKSQDARLVNALDESKPKRKKRDPWATLTETSDDEVRAELAKALGRNLRDGNFKVGWSQLAEQLGVPLEAPAKAAKGKKAPTA